MLNAITEETERIKSEMNIFDLGHAENVATYNSLTTILLRLKEIGWQPRQRGEREEKDNV